MDYIQFYGIKMSNKLSSILCSFILSFSLFAQDNSNLSYSSNGIGVLSDENRLPFSAIGNTMTSSVDSVYLNFYNPSSYASISKGQPIFSVAFNQTLQYNTSNGRKESGAYGNIGHFALGISFAKIVGISLGLRPFSKSNYNFSELSSLGNGQDMTHLYQGKGNSSLFFGGIAVNALNLKHHKLGVGTNLGYVFGSLINTQTAYINSEATVHKGVVYSTTNFLKSFYYDLGLNYQYTINKDKIIVGFSYTPQQKLNATHIFEKAYAKDIDDDDEYGYIESDVTKGSITLPTSMSFGLTYELNTRKKNQNAKLNSLIRFSAEYRMQVWKEYAQTFAPSNEPAYYTSNTNTYSFGVEYIPQQLFLERVTTGYMSKVRYRIGASLAQLPYGSNGTNIERQTYGIGFGFPFMLFRTTSSINLGVGYSNQSIRGNANYNDKFVQFSIGINFTPNVNDRWFRKYKID